jgi:zinc protease
MRRALFVSLVSAALVGLAATPAIGQEAPKIDFEHYELENGLDVILYEDHANPVVSVNVWYHVGSGNEKPGRSGFAHLFEHMMFQGSENHPGEYFEPLQKVGGSVNGSTNTDRTNYVQDVPSNYLERVLWLESDRMGFLLPAVDEGKFENQRSVVKNERRQNYENQPYGEWYPLLAEMLFPADHPYSWPTIGYMRDLDAATLEDVTEFFKMYYTPSNASIVITGDFDPAEAKRLVEKYFASIPPGPPVERITDWSPELPEPVQLTTQDNVELPRVYYAWHTPGYFKPGDAEFDLLGNILTDGKTSRLYNSLVYEQELAQDVGAFQWSREMGSIYVVQATARPGVELAKLEESLESELERLLAEGITEQELQKAKTTWQASFIRRIEQVGGFGGVANQLNSYNRYLGHPGGFAFDFSRYGKATASEILRYARTHLDPDKRATLRIVPQGQLQVVATDVDRSTMPEGGPEPSWSPPTIQEGELANGLKVLVVENHKLPLVQANLVVRSGFSADPQGLPGVASLAAELLDEGTTSRNALELDDEGKRLGAQLGTGSGFDGSQVNLNVLKSNLDGGLALLADVALNPSFPAEELERQRRIYMGRIAQEAKQPQTAAIKMFQQVLYGEGHPYAQPFTGTGTPESIKQIARRDLVSFYQANYKPNNSALVFTGDITLDEAMRQAEEHFGDWERGEVAMAEVPEPEPITSTQVYIVDKPGAQQSVIMVGNLGLRRSAEDYDAFQIMNNAFGGKFSSRVNLNLREDKGYSYGARSVFLGTRGVGPFVVLAPVQTQSTKESLVEILNEYRDVVGARPITEQEVMEAKGNMIKGMPRQFQTVGGVAGQVGDIFEYELPLDEWSASLERLAAITPEQATKAARDHLDADAVVIVIVGDKEVIEPGIKELNLGEVRYLAAGLGQENE